MQPAFPPLVTDEMMAAVRTFGYMGLQTEVVILTHEVVENPYGDDSEVWAETVTVWGWLHAQNEAVLGNQDQIVTQTGVFRLMLPVGTEVHTNDLVGISGENYTVQDTTAQNTYQVFLEVTVRRAE